jgi:hypothetical protein
LAVALKNGQFGLNVEPGNPRAVAGALECLAREPERLAAFAKAGFQYVEQFELTRVLARFEQELLSLITGPGSQLENKPANASDAPISELAGISSMESRL